MGVPDILYIFLVCLKCFVKKFHGHSLTLWKLDMWLMQEADLRDPCTG